MMRHQRGLSMLGVGIGSAALALVAMAALFSMRYERNLFAEGWAKVSTLAGANPALDTARDAVKAVSGAPDGALRSCVVNGKKIISNTECTDKNPTSKKIHIVDTKGFEAPKKPEPVPAAPTSNPALDKIIEKQLQ
jgi:hypothetical protein